MPRLPSKAKFWKKRSSANITEYDPTFRVVYLGNVLTGWAKGDGCVDKPLATLWKNHTTTDKPNIIMKVTVCASGLKAVTNEHGLTEYWAHRITFCNAEPAYSKVFCWIYRHEGRKLKQELRCHAVLCPSENKARLMAKRLKEMLHQALVDFKKEKVWRQNARLSLANAADEQKTMPFRKIMLQPGSSNYRPPHEKGKAAPKLKVIEEVIFEEDEDQLSSSDSEARDNTTQTSPEIQKPDLQKRISTAFMGGGRTSTSNHVTRLHVDGSCGFNGLLGSNGQCVTSSDSLPLLATAASILASSEMSSICSMDALSTLTTVTSSFLEDDQELALSSPVDVESPRKLNIENLIVISSDPSPKNSRRLRPQPQILANGFNHQVSSTPESVSEVDSEDEDQVIDYFKKLSVEVSSECYVGHVDSETPRSKAVTSNSKVSPRMQSTDSGIPVSPLITTRLDVNEQDTISDESGYSEESHPSNKDHDLEEDFDTTVKGVLISDFSPSERLKYLQRSQSTSSRTRGQQPLNGHESSAQLPASVHMTSTASDFFQNKMPEFCINI